MKPTGTTITIVYKGHTTTLENVSEELFMALQALIDRYDLQGHYVVTTMWKVFLVMLAAIFLVWVIADPVLHLI